ncbi:prominin-1-like [Littorina saxatilis]|uniref:prominin-1-like n=1 Tax=Littorina saxatilis TaxID=31220 RepID=UPI0038B5B8BE
MSGDRDNDHKDKDDLTNKSYTIDEGMLPFYRLAKAIAGEGFVTEYPFQLLEDVKSGSISLSALMKPMYFHAYIAEVVLGVTVVLALMVANCTFCKENKTPVRSSHAVALTQAKKGMRRVRIVSIACVILLVLALVGLITAAMSNSQQTEAFKQLFGVAHAALSRVVHVLDSIIWQMTTAFNEMLLSTQRFQVDLAKINETVDYSVQEELENLTGINKSLEALKAFEVTREQTYTALCRLDRDLDVYNQRVSELSAKMIGASNISNSSVVYPTLNVSTINVSLSLVDLEKIGENKDKFTSAVVVSAANVSRVVFASDTGAVDVSKAISKGILGSPLFRSILEGFKNKLVSVMQLEGNKEMVKKAKEKFMFYDNYRQMFMVIALVVEAIPMVILFAGAVMTPMVFTRFIKDSQSPMPHQIEVVADCLQTDSVPLMMSVLWMTLAVVYFAVGALTEGLVCMPVCDPEFRVLDVLVEDYDIMGEHGNTTWLANMLNMSDSNMTLGSVLKGCRRNDTLYTAMQLYLHPYVSIDQFFSFRDDINISGMLEVLQPEIVTSEALTPDILEYLQDLSDAADSVPLDDLNDLVKMDVARNMTHLRSELPEDLYTLLHALQIHKTTLNESLQEVKKLLTPNDQSLSKAISEAINATRQAENMIPLVNETAVDNGKDTAKGRLLENLDTGLKNVKWRIEERVGGCEPLYDLVKKVLLVGLCSNVTNTVNGFWLALGWLNLFLVPVVFLCAWLHRQIMKLPISPDPLHSSDFFWEKEEPVKPPSEDYSCGDDISLYDYDMDRRQGKLGWRRPWDHFTSPDPADQYRGYWGSEFMDHQEAGRRSRLARSSSPESSEYLELMDQVYGYRGSPENYRANDQTPWNQDDTRSYTQPRENGMYDNQPARGYEPYENDELDYQDGGGYDRQPYNQPHNDTNMPGPQSRRL